MPASADSPEGDMMRSRMPLRNGASTSFGQLNAGKKSVVLDLKHANAVKAVLRLAERANLAGVVVVIVGHDGLL
jgi:CoA:oxalate CoA-transferase